MPRKTLRERCVTTLKSMKTRAKKDGVTLAFTPDDLVARVPECCIYCHCKITPAILNIDHAVPLARGGSWNLDNLVGICAKCNRRKGTLDAAEYRALLRKLTELSEELGNDYTSKNVLARMAAGGAWIFK